MIKFSHRIGYRMKEHETDLPYLYRIKGDRMTIQIDAGNSPATGRAFLDDCMETDGKEPDLVILTHWHWDHCFGLDAVHAPALASKKTNEYLKKVCAWEWTDQAMKRRLETGEDIPYCDEKMRVEYPDVTKIHARTADWELDGSLTLDLGGITCILETHDSPHSRDALFIRIPEEQVLIAGDAEYEDYYDNNSQYDPARLADYIEYLKNTEFKWYMRGHDEAVTTKEDIISMLSEVLDGLLNKAEDK